MKSAEKHTSPVFADFRFYNDCFTRFLVSLQQGKSKDIHHRSC